MVFDNIECLKLWANANPYDLLSGDQAWLAGQLHIYTEIVPQIMTSWTNLPKTTLLEVGEL